MIRAWLRGGLSAAALLATGTAVTQEVPKKDDKEIVVTGVRDPEREINDFVQAFTPGSTLSQLSRFEWAVCPMTTGVSPAQKLVVVDRFRKVAKAAGVRIAGDGCAPNVLVIVTPDKRGLLEALFLKHPDYFTDLSKAERRALVESTEPGIAWHLKGPPQSADGMELQYDSGTGYYVNHTTRSLSRLSFASRPQFAAAIVMVENRALDGLTVNQLADYAAMRTLIRVDPTKLKNSAAPTILKILEAPMGSEIPLGLTKWDLGVLRGFYASDPNVTAASQRSEMRRRLKKELDPTGEEKK
ncbi:hypothetical protein [Sphingomonas sp.]|uniref:hypothetical protein n=1 Tax=Sphingomonas sp. TaxID=28214 RepID=UPI003D6C933F